MILETKHFGRIEVEEEKAILFPRGLVAFEEMKRYVLIDNNKGEVPLSWLQSLENPDLSFVVINPFYIKKDYEFEVSSADMEELGIEKREDTVVLTIVVVPEKIEQMTTNLAAPLVINVKTRKGKQIVLQSTKYHTRHILLQEISKDKCKENTDFAKS